MIREACITDIPKLVEMGRRFIFETKYRDAIGFDAESQQTLMQRLIDSSDGIIFILAPHKSPIGMMGVHVFAHPLSGETMAAEVFWWVEPEHRGAGLSLIHKAERWAKDRGAKKLHMIAPSEKVARCYETLGYAQLEVHYQKDL